MLLTDTVADGAQLCQRSGVLTEFPSVFVMHGVDAKVVVQMRGVGVCGHQHLMPRPRFFRKRQSDFVYLFGGHVFARRKRLHIMIKIHSALFVMCGLGRHKFRESIFCCKQYSVTAFIALMLCLDSGIKLTVAIILSSQFPAAARRSSSARRSYLQNYTTETRRR